MNIFVNYSSSIKNTIRNLKGESNAMTTQQSENVNKDLEEVYQRILRALCGEAEPQKPKDIQTAVKALQSQKSGGMSPKQLGEGFKETVERYKGIDSGSQSRKHPVTEYAKKIGLCDFNCGDAERGVFKN